MFDVRIFESKTCWTQKSNGFTHFDIDRHAFLMDTLFNFFLILNGTSLVSDRGEYEVPVYWTVFSAWFHVEDCVTVLQVVLCDIVVACEHRQ